MNLAVVSRPAPASETFLLASPGDELTRIEKMVPFAHWTAELRAILYSALIAVDVLCVAGSFLLAGAARLGSPLDQNGLRTVAIMLPTFAAIALNNGAYSVRTLRTPTFGARKAIEALIAASAVAALLLFYLKAGVQFSRIVFGVGTALSLISASAARVIFGNYIGRRYRWSFLNELVISDDVPLPLATGEKVVSAHELGLEPRVDSPMLLDRLSRVLHKCDRVVVACRPERRASWASALKGMSVSVEIWTPELGGLGPISVGQFRGEKTLVVSCGPLSTRDRLLKRSLDVAVAAASLVLLAPLMIVVAAVIVAESPGAVLFRQPRVGHNNRIFSLLKFRSMRPDCGDAAGTQSTTQGDSRITFVGRFIRSTSMDELPQLFNVLLGDMSIVGPRPHALGSTAESKLFWQIDDRYFDRHAIKPGITGLAQIRGLRGPTTKCDDLSKRLQCDLEYVAGWTIWRDLKIMCATIRVLVHRNAF